MGAGAVPRVSFWAAAVVGAAILVLAGCAGTPVTADPSVPAIPVTEAMPSPSATGTGFEFVTVESNGPAIAPDGWTARGPIVAWAEQYCASEGLSPCTGVAERAVDMCIERWDCHPAVLVPFEEGTAAFLSGGIFPQPEVIGVWRAESDPELAPYGGARALLEAYLLTVGVCPAEGGGAPRGPTCPRG